jgi:hypothetical protein
MLYYGDKTLNITIVFEFLMRLGKVSTTKLKLFSRAICQEVNMLCVILFGHQK